MMIQRLRKRLHLCPWGKHCGGEGKSRCLFHHPEDLGEKPDDDWTEIYDGTVGT